MSFSFSLTAGACRASSPPYSLLLSLKGYIHEPCLHKWWINKWDSAAAVSELASSEHGHGQSHGHGGSEHEHEHEHEHGAHSGHEAILKGMEKSEGEGNKKKKKKKKKGFNPNNFKFFLDLMQLFNCFYMGWFMSQVQSVRSAHVEVVVP